ncbi:MAG TPA: KUP/HAK/KT family potassium transporter, partial [Burkholderiaceae bacterium]|nr:KUP/HAK/KT family potassium transporter [Burkholderiaceae bacterium]
MSRSGIRPHAGVRPPSLLLAALGVVFGDIGTSPLYAFREAFAGNAPLPMAQLNVFAVLSMILWSLLIIVSLKYVLVMLRFDHEGEGGVLALMSYTLKRLPSRAAWPVTMLGLAGAGLFYGDAMITPAISVLAAVEGIAVAAPALEHWIVPVALIVLIGLFAIQPHGTASVGRLFGPVMVAWFVVLAALGLASIVQTPHVLLAADPRYAAYFAIEHPGLAMLALTAVFLCLTGAEALYADLGHFGRSPIRRAWFLIAFPALIVNYFGQGALVLRDPSAAASPFYLLAPAPLVIPLIVLATAATVIASQAVISAAFSVSQQASRLNCLPRLQVRHTSDLTQGQIFIPSINWALLVAVVLLVLAFRSSANLAGAYGVAVSAVLLIGTLLLALALIAQRG